MSADSDFVVESGDRAETDDVEAKSRDFLVVTHKPGVLFPFMAFGARQDIGISVDPDTAPHTLWWMGQEWASRVLAAGVGLPQLTAPGPGFIAALDEKWLHRRSGTLRLCDVQGYFSKHPEQVRNNPQVIISTTAGDFPEMLPSRLVNTDDLVEGKIPSGFDRLPPDVFVQVDEVFSCVAEVRCWVADGKIVATSVYRLGMVGWDSSLFLEMLFNAQGQELIAKAVGHASNLVSEVSGPPGYALDIGTNLEGVSTVLRAWPSWAVEPLSGNAEGVYQSLVASQVFEGQNLWEWSPEPAYYDRSLFFDQENDREVDNRDIDN